MTRLNLRRRLGLRFPTRQTARFQHSEFYMMSTTATLLHTQNPHYEDKRLNQSREDESRRC